ncbi:MAG: V-type ATP synthase subunit A, partial [Candidatus Fimenecus sp.]
MSVNQIYGINGPVVTVKGETDLGMLETVFVGNNRLIGEVIGLNKDFTTIQVYEETAGLTVGEPIDSTGAPMCVTLGPGLLGNIFDGIQRPLPAIEAKYGAFIGRGAQFAALNTEKKYDVTVQVKVGDRVSGGDVFATCPETSTITHKAMVPPALSGEIVSVKPHGQYTVEAPLAVLKTDTGKTVELTLAQKWPIRTPRPTTKRLPANKPLVTGQRVIDTVFPIAKGGAAAIPGGFGTGKTMTQHQLAKWCDADIIIYVGCGERGNEMTQVLEEFSELVDPRTGKPLLERTVLIANTSNMPVAA